MGEALITRRGGGGGIVLPEGCRCTVNDKSEYGDDYTHLSPGQSVSQTLSGMQICHYNTPANRKYASIAYAIFIPYFIAGGENNLATPIILMPEVETEVVTVYDYSGTEYDRCARIKARLYQSAPDSMACDFSLDVTYTNEGANGFGVWDSCFKTCILVYKDAA